MRLGWPEIVIILVIVLIIFGVGKLPQIGGAIGKSIKEFRRNQNPTDSDEKKTALKADDEPQSKS